MIKLLTRLSLLIALVAGSAAAQTSDAVRQELRDFNLLGNNNAGFENGTSRWTSAGTATYSVTSTAANVGFGTRSASWDAGAASATLTSATITLPAGVYGAQCEANFVYKGGDTGLSAQVIDGSSTTLITRTLQTATTFTEVRLPFTCPTSGSVKFRLSSSANAAVVYLDQVYLGITRMNVDVSPVVYSVSKSAVGAVGSSGQMVAGHTLVAEDFPVTAGKIAFWNLSANANDGSGALSCSSAACNLTANGSPTYTTTSIAGVASSAPTLNGTSQYFNSTSTFFKPGNSTSYAWGGWFKATDWTPSALQYIGGNHVSGSDRGFYAYLNTDGSIVSTMTNTATTDDFTLTHPNPGFTDATWHHIAFVFDHAAQRQKLYIDGRLVASRTATNQRAPTGSNFYIPGVPSASGYWTGSVQEAFFHNSGASSGALTDDDIRKLYAYKLSHNKGVPTSEQQWQGVYSRSDDKLDQQMMSDWIVHQDANSVWWDLSGLSSTSRFSAKLQQLGFTSTIVPASTYTSGELSAAPTVPITHNLPGRPQWVLVEQEGQIEATSWSPVDGVCWAKGDTQINCDFTGLTIDSTHKIRITASMAHGSTAVREASGTRLGLVTSYAPSVTAGVCSKSADYTITSSDACETILVTTGASNRTITLPVADSTNTGRRLKLIKADSGAGSAGFSGTISGRSTNNAINRQYGYGTVISDGTQWIWEQDIKESGSWTPTWTASATPFASVTYGNRTGWYDRDGSKVCINSYVDISNTTGVPAGLLAIGALPYASANVANRYSNFAIWFSNVDLPAGAAGIQGYMAPNTSFVQFQAVVDNANASDVLSASNGGSSRAAMVQGCYSIN